MCLEMDGFEHSFTIILVQWMGQTSEGGTQTMYYCWFFLIAGAFQRNIFFFFSFRLHQVDDVLVEEKSLDFLQDPTRIFNSDKSSFQFFPKTGKVLECTGDKNVYKVDRGFGKPFITAAFTFCASGMTCPPMLIYPYQRILSQIT